MWYNSRLCSFVCPITLKYKSSATATELSQAHALTADSIVSVVSSTGSVSRRPSGPKTAELPPPGDDINAPPAVPIDLIPFSVIRAVVCRTYVCDSIA